MATKRYLRWDTSEITKDAAEQEVERALDIDDEVIDLDEAYNRVYNDPDVFQWAWDDLTECLTEWLKEKNDTPYWKCDVNNFGWRHLDGYKYFKARDGEELLRAILPDTDCTFTIYNDGKHGIKIENAHHDAPMGGEWYYIRRATIKEQNAGYFD